jgi:hypothetical protein
VTGEHEETTVSTVDAVALLVLALAVLIREIKDR